MSLAPLAPLYLACFRSTRPLPSRLHRPCRSSHSLHSSFIHYFPQHCGIGFLDDSGRSSKPEDEGGKSASGARQGGCDVGAVWKSGSIIMNADLVKAASEV